MDGRGPHYTYISCHLAVNWTQRKRGCSLLGSTHMLPSDLGKEGTVGSEIARPQVIVSFSPHPHFCPCSQRHRGGQAVPLGTL